MSEDRPRDRLDDEEVLKRLGAALRADHAEIDAADDSSMPAPSAALRARVLAAAEAEVFGAPKEITRLRPPARRAPLAAAAFVLVAAAASFALWGRAPAGDLAIPPYEAELATADVDTRGAEGTAGAPLHVSGERFVLVVRPKVAPSGPVRARAPGRSARPSGARRERIARRTREVEHPPSPRRRACRHRPWPAPPRKGEWRDRQPVLVPRVRTRPPRRRGRKPPRRGGPSARAGGGG